MYVKETGIVENEFWWPVVAVEQTHADLGPIVALFPGAAAPSVQRASFSSVQCERPVHLL